MATRRWNSRNCFGINNDVHMQRVLSILSGSRHSYSNRTVIDVHPSFLKANCSFQTGVMSVNTWFLRRRGLAMGITASGASLGGVIFPFMLKRLFNSVGFSWAVRIESFLTLGLLIIANIFVKSRLPPPGWTKGRQIFDFAALKEPVFCFVMVYP